MESQSAAQLLCNARCCVEWRHASVAWPRLGDELQPHYAARLRTVVRPAKSERFAVDVPLWAEARGHVRFW